MTDTLVIMRTAAVTNVRVAEAIGLTHSTVSRIRSGERLPSVEVMQNIEKEYKWSIADQVKARSEGVYHEKFEDLLVRKHGVNSEVYDVVG